MKLVLLGAALFMGQSQVPHTSTVRLPAHVSQISMADGGKTVELLDAAPLVSLPQQPPHVSFNGVPWYVDIKNLGPGSITLQGNNGFTVHLTPNGFVHIRSVGTGYAVTTR